MMDFVLIIGVLAILGAGSLIWKFTHPAGKTTGSEIHVRPRENARDWQRRFGPGSLLHANFHQPTQNEILETLYVLDFLMPGWEMFADDITERRFFNELALSFPNLRKTPCEFPLPFAEIWKTTEKSGFSRPQYRESPREEEAEFAAKREGYQLSRAQTNAREQIVAGLGSPSEISTVNPPFRLSNIGLNRRVRHPWLRRIAGATVLLAATLATTYLLSNSARPPSTQRLVSEVFTPPPELSPARAEPAPVIPAIPEIIANATAAPTPAPMAAPTPGPTPPIRTTPSVATQEKAALDQKIAASKQRAVTKYPALVVEGSEINLRFVFRYKNLFQTHSPRLQEPNWPEQLAEECAAAAAGTPPKRNAFTQISGAPR